MKNEIIANSCRICLTQTKKLRSLYKPIDEGDEPPNKMLHLITGIKVEKLDEHETLPKNICKNCELSLNMAFEFRENALKTQEIITSYLQELNGYESNEESNRSAISNYKTEYEEIMNLEPLDCVDALEEDIQIMCKDEHKSVLDNEEELNESASGDENPIGDEDEEQQEYYKQQEESYILKERDENDDDGENDHENYSDHQAEKQYEVQEDQEQTICEEENEELEYKDQLMSTEEEDTMELHKSLTKTTKRTKTNKNKVSKLKSLAKTTDSNSVENMKLIPRRGRKPTNSKNENGHICDICGNVFAKLGRMMEHRQRHDKEHRYSCEICNQTFLTRELLRKHMFSHSGGKPLKCKYCSRTFYYESVRRAHEAVHQGHKPYVCDVCDKAFSYAHALKKHKLIHAEIKLYRCEYCAKDFRLQHHLKQHEDTRLHRNTVRLAHGGKAYYGDYITGLEEQDGNEDILFIEEITDDQLASGS